MSGGHNFQIEWTAYGPDVETSVPVQYLISTQRTI